MTHDLFGQTPHLHKIDQFDLEERPDKGQKLVVAMSKLTR
jgi:hypothetical protein